MAIANTFKSELTTCKTNGRLRMIMVVFLLSKSQQKAMYGIRNYCKNAQASKCVPLTRLYGFSLKPKVESECKYACHISVQKVIFASKTDNYCVLHAGSMPQANWSVHRGGFVSIYISSLQRETALYFFHSLSLNTPVSNKTTVLQLYHALESISERRQIHLFFLLYLCSVSSFFVCFFHARLIPRSLSFLATALHLDTIEISIHRANGWTQKISSGSPENVFLCFLVIKVFHKEAYEPPLRSNWTQTLEGVRTSVSKETFSHL